MSGKANIKKTKAGKVKKLKNPRQNISAASLRMRYTFWILLITLFLAGIAMILRVETPVVWTFLYGVGSWGALTNNFGK
ncbi:MAG TPA: hypothetical protein VJ830_09015 [Anaerolineales bacterium]|nr:hypothetical protein [Anaerolineales bacterium]